MMQTLDEIALSTGTDRSSAFHAYSLVYGELLENRRGQPVRLIEMGVLNGGGLEMWSRYFPHPDAQIIGIDIHTEWCRDIHDPRVKLVKSSYVDPMFWQGAGDFDLAFDDGPHFCQSQVECFEMAWPHINPGGLYCIEDCHSVHCPQLTNLPFNIIQYFANIAVAMQDKRGADGCSSPAASDPYYSIESIEFRKGLIIVKKRE